MRWKNAGPKTNLFKNARWLLIPAVLAAGAWLWIVKFESEKPAVRLLRDGPALGRELSLRFEDRKSGLARIRVEADQAGRTVELLSEEFPEPVVSVEKTISLRPLPGGLTDGEIILRIAASDHSWRKGNAAVWEMRKIIDTRPPRMTFLGGPHSIAPGGAGVVSFMLDESAALSGLQAGNSFFPAYEAGGGRYFVWYALPCDAPPDVPFIGVAEDEAGNRTNVRFRPDVKSVRIKSDVLTLTDAFFEGVVPYFKSLDPSLKGTDLEIFLAVNRDQRARDDERLQAICRDTGPRPLWRGTFLRLPRSKTMAAFGERRTYLYNGREIDRQIHLGVDLASVRNCPVPAANAGRVVFAGPLGIYGETVILDHGCGLFSMYCHLSRIDAAVSSSVARGDVLGLSGATGMAGGDHLHFAMLVHGVFVDPVEWWDVRWIQNNVAIKMESE